MTMKQLSIEEKELLLKDLCARLPYDVMGSEILNNKIWGLPELLLNVNVEEEKVECSDSLPYSLENFRPYLRPMSSMTEEERKEYKKFDDFGTSTLRKYEYQDFIVLVPSYDRLDWLLSHHFDFRYPSLISLGLAIEVTDSNNPYKE